MCSRVTYEQNPFLVKHYVTLEFELVITTLVYQVIHGIIGNSPHPAVWLFE